MVHLYTFLLLLLLLFTFHTASTPTAESYSTYTVHLNPSSCPTPFTTKEQWHSSIVTSIKSSARIPHFSSLENSFLYSFKNALHGFNAVLTEPELQTLNPSTGLWPASNFGQGVIIGVIIWPEIPSFDDQGMTTIKQVPIKMERNVRRRTRLQRQERGFYWSGDDEEVSQGCYQCPPIGSTVSVWPQSLVFGKEYERHHYYVEITYASEGTVSYEVTPLYENPIAIASFGAMEKGSSSHPRLAMLTVGAGTFDRTFVASLTLGSDKARKQHTIVGKSMYPLGLGIKDETLVYNKTLSKCNDSELLSKAPHGILVCEHTWSLGDQMSQITRAATNLVAAIFVCKDPSRFDFDWTNNPAAVLISTTDLEAVMDYIKSSDKPIASIKFQQTVTGKETAPVVAEYTSRDPTPTIAIENASPDLNYPSFLAFVLRQERDFYRRGDDEEGCYECGWTGGAATATYKVKVDPPMDSTVSVCGLRVWCSGTSTSVMIEYCVEITYASDGEGTGRFRVVQLIHVKA
ncbi:unnamed protein product [Linum tenue]|uniref:Inhibitor I9 domain-containing protein n=1 Tax=Linum tenue TaxID=586396 RepID=A0AAV0P256_9ROSI|nr:unnamed protein product [Linum tenue]